MSSLVLAATYYTVKPGDSLYLIAQKHGISLASLRTANNLYTNNIYPGQTLVISQSGGSGGGGSGQTYVVKPGDSLWKISTQFGVSVSALQAANGLSGSHLSVGQRLMIPGSGSSATSTYTVKSGDTLSAIAKRFGTTVVQIQQLNGLNSTLIYPGQVLRIKGSGGSNPTPPPSSSGQAVYLHQVKWGETLQAIAGNYGVSANAIASVNSLPSWNLNSTMALIIPNPTKNQWQLTKVQLKSGYSVSDLNKLARMTYAEAGAEPYAGQVAVAAVILNRIKSPDFPNTLDGVLLQPRQFEPVINGYYYRVVASMSVYKAVIDAINGWDPTGGALFFFEPTKITNQWLLSKPVIYRVGSHVFAK